VLDSLTESTRYESSPRYYEQQPDYLNSVVVGSTDLDPFELLERLHSIEAAEGRDRSHSVPMGPRPLDIDILLYGDLVIDSNDLVVPHRRMIERKFVLLPLLELAPDILDPVTGIPLFDFFTKLEDQGIYYHSLDVFQD
jgi:2-amino-4-hydroxy-6-hydroxymethyldihydropteridine diphosphokinase